MDAFAVDAFADDAFADATFAPVFFAGAFAAVRGCLADGVPRTCFVAFAMSDPVRSSAPPRRPGKRFGGESRSPALIESTITA
ncbi:MAG TPA: hypothetical protein VGD80_30585 [Kofleriaceae bacterium]